MVVVTMIACEIDMVQFNEDVSHPPELNNLTFEFEPITPTSLIFNILREHQSLDADRDNEFWQVFRVCRVCRVCKACRVCVKDVCTN